jgi:hypothetical protein
VRDESDILTGAVTCAWLAVVVAAFVTACIYFVVTTPRGYSMAWSDTSGLFLVSTLATMIALLCSGIVAVLVGLPTLRWLYHRGYTAVLPYFIGGALMSVACVFALAVVHASGKFPFEPEYPLALWITCISGPLAALTARRLLVPTMQQSSNNAWSGR